MKKLLSLVLLSLTLLGLSSCGEKVKTRDVPSELFSQSDISSAMAVIEKEFKKGWRGCTLKEIYYAGDELTRKFADYPARYDADEVIVLLSSFHVDSSGRSPSLNPDFTYNDWNWILVRNEGEAWRHVDHGY